MSLLLLMAWVASCDGSVDDEEVQEMGNIIGTGPARDKIPTLLGIVRAGDLDALELASRTVKAQVAPARRQLFMQLLIRIALADGYLRTTESHVLRFVADLLELTPAALSNTFNETAGSPFPEPGDPSRASWWLTRSRPTNQGSQQGIDATNATSIARLRALAILGLDEKAGPDEIRAAYRRLSQVHHPDRFASLDQAATHAATESFRRIRDAYEQLVSDA